RPRTTKVNSSSSGGSTAAVNRSLRRILAAIPKDTTPKQTLNSSPSSPVQNRSNAPVPPVTPRPSRIAAQPGSPPSRRSVGSSRTVAGRWVPTGDWVARVATEPPAVVGWASAATSSRQSGRRTGRGALGSAGGGGAGAGVVGLFDEPTADGEAADGSAGAGAIGWVIPSESVSERSSPAPYRSHGGAGPVSGWIGAVPVSCSWTSKRLSRSAPPAVSDPDDAADPDVGPHPAGSVAV